MILNSNLFWIYNRSCNKKKVVIIKLLQERYADFIFIIFFYFFKKMHVNVIKHIKKQKTKQKIHDNFQLIRLNFTNDKCENDDIFRTNKTLLLCCEKSST